MLLLVLVWLAYGLQMVKVCNKKLKLYTVQYYLNGMVLKRTPKNAIFHQNIIKFSPKKSKKITKNNSIFHQKIIKISPNK